MRALRLRLVAVVLVAFGLGTLLGWGIFGDHGDDKQATTAASSPGAAIGASAAKVSLSKPVGFPKLGVGLRHPASWQLSSQGGVIKLTAPDSTVSLAISVSGPAHHEKQVRRFDQAQLLKLFSPAHVVARQRGKVGRLPALSTEIAGTTKRHKAIRILTTAATTSYRTYSVQIFSAPRPPVAHLAEVRAILDSFRFTRPTS